MQVTRGQRRRLNAVALSVTAGAALSLALVVGGASPRDPGADAATGSADSAGVGDPTGSARSTGVGDPTGSAGAADLPGSPDKSGYRLSGPGIDHPGRDLKLSLLVTHSAIDPALTPDVLDRVTVTSGSLRFNGDAAGVATCHARRTNDGNAAVCPRGSLVGHGRIAGVLGTPGRPVDEFGPLSSVSANFKLYNYRHNRRQSARMLAVIETIRPFGGFAVNLTIPVSRAGAILIDVPDVPQLPELIGRAYPTGTRLVATRISATVDAGVRRGRRPFVRLRTPHRYAVTIATDGA